MKKYFFILFVISASVILSGCSTNRIAERIVNNWEANTLKQLKNPAPGEEPKLRAHLADIYNAKAQFIMVNKPEKSEEARYWLQQSVDLCRMVTQKWPDAYANDKVVRTKVNLTMGNNMFLVGNQEETAHWCSYIRDVDCPQVIKELQSGSNIITPAIDTFRVENEANQQKIKNEANKQVAGTGYTELERLTIHWNINTRPQGADCYWRVKSSTPDVKNQNEKYLAPTPYESTETYDIKGLSRDTAGDVQIEIRCSKPGYSDQKKVFNVLSVLDEKEISIMMPLVKDE